MGFTETADSSGVLDRDFFTIVGFHIFQNILQPVQGFVLLSGDRGRADRSQGIEKGE